MYQQHIYCPIRVVTCRFYFFFFNKTFIQFEKRPIKYFHEKNIKSEPFTKSFYAIKYHSFFYLTKKKNQSIYLFFEKLIGHLIFLLSKQSICCDIFVLIISTCLIFYFYWIINFSRNNKFFLSLYSIFVVVFTFVSILYTHIFNSILFSIYFSKKKNPKTSKKKVKKEKYLNFMKTKNNQNSYLQL